MIFCHQVHRMCPKHSSDPSKPRSELASESERRTSGLPRSCPASVAGPPGQSLTARGWAGQGQAGQGWVRRARATSRGLGRGSCRNYGGPGKAGPGHQPKLHMGLCERSRKAATSGTARWGGMGSNPFRGGLQIVKTINYLGFFGFFYDLFTILARPGHLAGPECQIVKKP